MSNDGTSYKPWKVRKGVFKSTGTSEYTVPPRNTPSPIIEMPMSPSPVKLPFSPLSPLSPRVTITESPLSPPILHSNPSNLQRTVREIPIEFDEVRVLILRLFHSGSLLRCCPRSLKLNMKRLKISKTENVSHR